MLCNLGLVKGTCCTEFSNSYFASTNISSKYYKHNPAIIQLALLLYIRYPLSLLAQVEDMLYERGVDISHESIRLWWNRFGPAIASKDQKRSAHLILSNIQIGGGTLMKFSSSKSEVKTLLPLARSRP